MKRICIKLLTVFIPAMLIFSYGCVPGRVKKQANANKKQYEGAFIQKVENEYGPGYTLSDIEGEIYWDNWDFRVIPGYEAGDSLTGKLEHNGEIYDIEYNFMADTLRTNANHREIIDDLANTMGLDSSKITYGCFFDPYDVQPMLNSDIHTVDEVLKEYAGLHNLRFYIVTEEDVSELEFFDYSPFLARVADIFLEYDFSVYIFSSDDFTDLEHFKENCNKIGPWYDGKKHPEVEYNGESKDVFDIYNLQGLTRVFYSKESMSVINY